jgi:antitoxin component YwqK of YwqJK toxin-antitoxin module
LRLNFSVFFQFICVALMVSCGEDITEPPKEIPTEWKGQEEDFRKEFVVEPDEKLPILLHRESAVPFAGKLERNGTKLKTIQTFEDGRLNGVSIKKSKDGSWVEANYKNGQLHGEMIFFGKNGVKRSVLRYENGKLAN